MFGVTDQLRYVETILQPGDSIIAVGCATVEIDPTWRAPVPRELPVICQLTGADEAVVITDAEDL